MCKGIKEDIIPNALMYYLGVKLDDDSGSSGSEEHKKKPKPEGKNKANCEQQ